MELDLTLDLGYYQIADGIAEQGGEHAAAAFFLEELLEYKATAKEKLHEIKEIRKTGFLSSVPYLANAVYESILLDLSGEDKSKRKLGFSEAKLQSHFYKHLGTLIPGAFQVKVPTNSSYRPDGFVMVESDLCAVEVKKTRFTKSSLSQLLGYMRHYNCTGGIAVAQELCTQLPDNVRWVQITEQAVFDHQVTA